MVPSEPTPAGIRENRVSTMRVRLSLICAKTKAVFPHPKAKVDLGAHPAGREDAVTAADRRYAADGKAVTPVDIRHGERIADDAWEVCNVHNLSQAVICLKAGH